MASEAQFIRCTSSSLEARKNMGWPAPSSELLRDDSAARRWGKVKPAGVIQVALRVEDASIGQHVLVRRGSPLYRLRA